MNDTLPTLEDRLVAYRQPLDEALRKHPAPTAATMRRGESFDADAVAAFDLESHEPVTPPRWSTFALAAACVALIAGAGILLANRTEPSSEVPSNGFDDAAPVACAREAGSSDVGDPAPDLDFDSSQFLVALPAETPPRVLAVRALLNPVAGTQCLAFDTDSIATLWDEATGTVTASLEPPAAGTAFEVRLTIERTAEAIGITRIDGLTPFDVDRAGATATLNLADDLPDTAAEINVTFRVGTEVIDLTVDPARSASIPLVPEGDSVGPEEDPVWVTYVIRDEAGRALDTGGAVLP